MTQKIKQIACGAALLSAALLTTAPASAAYTWHCNVLQVQQTADHIKVICSNAAWGTVDHFALDRSRQTDAEESQFITMATTALLADKQLRIRGSHLPGNNPPGCEEDNCRLITEWGLRK